MPTTEHKILTNPHREDNVAEALQHLVTKADVIVPDRLFCLMSNGMEQEVAIVGASIDTFSDMIYSFLTEYPQFVEPISIALTATIAKVIKNANKP